LKPALLNVIIDAAMAVPGGLGIFGRVKLRAARLADRRGAQEVALQDFIEAVAEVPGIPGRVDVEATASLVVSPHAKPSRQRRNTPAELARELCPGGPQNDLSVNRMSSGSTEGLLSEPALEAV
jgi:hypothetical protein